MKGKKISSLLVACLCLGTMAFSACQSGGIASTSSENTQQEQDTRIEAVYAQYVAYAEQNGQKPMSYEEWLNTIKGADGKDGEDGVNGKSAYEVWLANGYSGTQSDFLEWLKGEKGEQGEQGVGIESVTVDENGDLIVTYTDGTTQKIEMPKEEHVHTFGEWLTFDEDKGLLYRICEACNSVDWIAEKIVTTKEELIFAAVNGGVVSIEKDLALDTAVYVTKDLTVNLMGNLSIPNDTAGNGVFYVGNKSTLILNGNGTVNGVGNNVWNMALFAENKAEVIINGGYYTNVGAKDSTNPVDPHFDLIYVKYGATVTINGGTFKCETPKWTLNSSDSKPGTIEVKGGKFYKFNPETDANDATVYVADGYKVVQDGDWYEVVAE